MSHLKTGYFNELWLPLEHYRELAKKYKLGCRLLNTVQEEKSFPERLPEGLDLSFLPEGFGPSIETPEVPEEDKKEIIRLQERILGKFGLIMLQAEHGTPLKGTCQACPSKSVVIE
jgi:hypothetical protein